MQVLRRRFEDTLAYPAKVIHDIAEFHGLSRPENAKLLDPKMAHEQNPIRNPIRGIDGWRSQIGIDELARVRNLHCAAARVMGYVETDIAEDQAGDAPRSFADATIERDEKTTLQK